MGAEFIYEKVDPKRTNLETVFHELQREADSYSGHQEGYSGDWNTISSLDVDSSKQFASLRQAVDWLSANVPKWSAIAVRYSTDAPKVPKGLQRKLEKAIERWKRHDAMRAAFSRELRFRKPNAKGMVTCSGCGSKLNTLRILRRNGFDCPVCDEHRSLLDRQQAKALARIEAASEKAQLEVNAIRKQIAELPTPANAKYQWVIGGCAPC